MRRRLASMLGNVALLGFATLVALALGEVATRLLRPQQLRRAGTLYRPADSLGYTRRPDHRETVNTGERPVVIVTDQYGFRIGSSPRVEADTRVLIIGDSFMEALAVPHEETLAGLLERELPDRIGRAVAVRNGGVSGYSPSQYVLATRNALAHESYGVVIVALFTGNDIGDAQAGWSLARQFRRPRPRWPRQWTLKGINRDLVMPLSLSIQRWSHLAVLAWTSSDLVRIRLGLADVPFPRFVLRELASAPNWDAAAALAAEIDQLVTGTGGRAVFVIIPQFMQIDPATTYRYAGAFGIDSVRVDPDQPNRLLAASLGGRGLQVLDALPALRRAVADGRPVYGRRDPHLTPDGHRTLAELVGPWVARELAR